jgi:hypothetical protein
MDAYGRRRHFGTANRVTAWLSTAFTAAILCLPLAAQAAVPSPTITGPIPATVTSPVHRGQAFNLPVRSTNQCR